MFKKEIYKQRRARLAEILRSGILILPANSMSSMNYRDNHYPFRQDSSFAYFTGVNQPDAVLLMDLNAGEEYLFARAQTVTDIIWEGKQANLQQLGEQAGISKVKDIKDWKPFIGKLVAQQRKVHYLPPYRPEHVTQLSQWLQLSPAEVERNVSVEFIKAVVSLRSVKTQEEIVEINKAVVITEQMIQDCIQSAQKGQSEWQLAARLQYMAQSRQAEFSFPPILTVNGQWLHTHATNKVLEDGEMVLCDCGAENNMNYAGDLTRTFPVSKKFTSKQKDIYNVVLAAQEAAIQALCPGKLHLEVHLLACEQLVEGLKSLGIMKGNAQEAVQAGAHTLFFPCGLGHMMGMDVHDMENLGEAYVGYTDDLKQSKQFGLRSLRLGKALEAGYVLTVEPGIYMNADLMDEWEATRKCADFINYSKLQAYRNFGGIRIEDDYLITASGSTLLGNGLARTTDEIEALRSA